MTFIERPHENEKTRALTYVSKLLEDAINSKEDRTEDIKELEDIQKLLSRKKYGLVWEQHAEQFEADMKFNIPVFVENKSKKMHYDNDKLSIKIDKSQFRYDSLSELNELKKHQENFIDLDSIVEQVTDTTLLIILKEIFKRKA